MERALGISVLLDFLSYYFYVAHELSEFRRIYRTVNIIARIAH